jgi:hypothetical protein
MIPHLTSLPGAPWDVLPAGIHIATFSEVEVTFAINAVRRELFAELLDAAISLRGVGCVKLYLDGSFVTGKPIPGDYDACWDSVGVDLKKLDPVFRDFSNKRQAQKAKFKGEFFPSTMKNAPTQPFVDFFQVDRFTGLSKGILLILLGADPVLLGRLAP